MMRVLAVLLMPPVKLFTDRRLESCNQPINGYSPAPTGLLEVGRNQYMHPTWLRKMFSDNSLMKIFYEGLPYLPSAEGSFKSPIYTIIFMRRNAEEIKKSTERTEQYIKDLQAYAEENDIPVEDRQVTERFGGFDIYKEYDEDDIAHVLSICNARRDIEVIEVKFEDFIKDTRKELLKVTEQLPLLITKESFDRALAQVNPEFHRIKCG
jgi:hypothetical protein